MTHVDLIPALNKMVEDGSGFYSLLAKTWLKADLENSRKLFREFAIELECYGISVEKTSIWNKSTQKYEYIYWLD